MIHQVRTEIGGRTLMLETGRVARQADGGVWVQYGDTVVLMSAVHAPARTDQLSFFPLTVDYRELAYAAGKIPGGFFKREGRPRDKEILGSRIIDRPIRPLFPANFRSETQVTGFLLSADLENEGEILGIIGASAALAISEIPFQGPLGAVRIGSIDGTLVVNPTLPQLETSTINLVVCGTRDTVVMVEGEAREASDDQIIAAIDFARAPIAQLVDLQQELMKLAGKPKLVSDEPVVPPDLEARVRALATARVAAACAETDREHRGRLLDELQLELETGLAETFPEQHEAIGYVLDEVVRAEVRRRTVTTGVRLDGRRGDEIRPITCQVGVLPRTHGSALFTRGQTQCLAVVTLGSKSDEQKIDDVEREEYKSFMLHYNFPPFSVGEVRPMRGPSRREIGHGALAERSIEAVLPRDGSFPYTIRIVSDILESNGSSSMATVCGASLSLMDAGVPITAPAAGIAMGLIREGGQEIILTDIMGDEDHYGDMDYKVAGTARGITGIQLDLKVKGVSIETLAAITRRATESRRRILETMASTIATPRPAISQYAPKIVAFNVPKEKIGEIIGPGGKVIRRITEDTGAEIDIDDDGRVTISAVQADALARAEAAVKAIIAEVEVGKVYPGTVTRILNFGAFVEVLPGKEGLVHISRLADHRVKSVEDVVKVGDKVNARVIGIDEQGRINLSMRTTPEPPDDARPRPKHRRRR